MVAFIHACFCVGRACTNDVPNDARTDALVHPPECNFAAQNDGAHPVL